MALAKPLATSRAGATRVQGGLVWSRTHLVGVPPRLVHQLLALHPAGQVVAHPGHHDLPQKGHLALGGRLHLGVHKELRLGTQGVDYGRGGEARGAQRLRDSNTQTRLLCISQSAFSASGGPGSPRNVNQRVNILGEGGVTHPQWSAGHAGGGSPAWPCSAARWPRRIGVNSRQTRRLPQPLWRKVRRLSCCPQTVRGSLGHLHSPRSTMISPSLREVPWPAQSRFIWDTRARRPFSWVSSSSLAAGLQRGTQLRIGAQSAWCPVLSD